VCRGLGINVADGDAAVILIDHISRCGARQNFAKEAIGLSHGRMITQSLGFTSQFRIQAFACIVWRGKKAIAVR
jgi:hypothetical protein